MGRVDEHYYTVIHSGGAVTLERFMEAFDLTEEDVDAGIGLMRISSKPIKYCVSITSEAGKRLQSRDEWEIAGPYDNPKLFLPDHIHFFSQIK